MLPVVCLIINAIDITKVILSVLKKLKKEDIFFPHQGFGSNWETVAETEDEAQNI